MVQDDKHAACLVLYKDVLDGDPINYVLTVKAQREVKRQLILHIVVLHYMTLHIC